MHIHIGDANGQTMRDLALQIEAGLLTLGVLKLCEKAETSACSSCVKPEAARSRRIHRAVHQRIRILGKDLVIVEIIVVEKEKISCQAIFALNRGGIDLRNASVETARIRRESPAAVRFRWSTPTPTRGAKLVALNGTLPASGHSGLGSIPFVLKVCRS